MQSVAFQLENARFRFPDSPPLLEGVDWTQELHSKSVLIGPSGAGKTILLKILSGLFALNEGKYELFGSVLSEVSKRERKFALANVAMTFQRSGLFDSYSIFENLDFPLRELTTFSSLERKEKIEWMLGEVGLSAQKDLYPHEISGGMQKRLGIARALLLTPKLLLCDDPTAGLDPITSSQILDLILRLVKHTDSTLVISTSDLLIAKKLSKQGASVHFLYQGKMHHFSSWQEIWETEFAEEKQFVHGEKEGPLTEKI